MSRGAELIAEERDRQIYREGWNEMHDDQHSDGSLVWAAICYAASSLCEDVYRRWAEIQEAKEPAGLVYSDPWPWDKKWDKRSKHDRERKLAIAGALIAAELDRLLREEQGS